MICVDEQIKIIKKGVLDMMREEELREKLKVSVEQNNPLTIKLGLDPSAPDIHLGHTVVLRKIKQMQDLGHRAIIIIGDFTGRIGDPTGKSKTRKPLTDEQVKENAATYMEQIFKVLDREKTEVRFNSEWLSKLNFEQVISLASSMTVARLLERDDFQNRYKNQEAIGLHEFFYPLMQGYDSVEIKADIELGGTDQTFNILMGRTLQKSVGMSQQIAMFMPILEGLDGIEKMSKSLGNYIGVSESPQVMFKKVMEVPDQLIFRYFELVTDEHPDDIEKLRIEMEQGKNPRDIKLILARIITNLYHGEEGAKAGEEYFEQVFKEGEIPEDMPVIKLEKEQDSLASVAGVLASEGLVPSASEFRRLIKQGGVQLNREKVLDIDCVLTEQENVLKIGKKKFVRLVF
ncbi:tyrosine--tRNA ligase [Lachnoclostridium phytofermentans]|uniref:Tyrosine--tRNA ligase n=1 Tax=Lachnoclostridium phytofermentans (strain ATCC 700394 / DSM 18823 / ISDg) TaxID=357809 RepID=A9KKH7_LACP7|nr:tyrosine--tRNA ligase [Lachnoclostridium phytofermentans]ABX41148.1 tyrosyl-tRNA synthetase [Lachnoclostridium phytofermentans ISDg]